MSPVNLTTEAFAGIELVAVVAFLAPLLLDLVRLRFLPAVVLEIGAGMIIGPYGVGWVRGDDLPIQIFALIGLSFLLFLAGMEVHLTALRGFRLRSALVGFTISFALALLISTGLWMLGLIISPLLVAIILSSCSLGIVLAPLKALNLCESQIGQLVIVSASIGEFGALILLSIFFSNLAVHAFTRVVLLGGLALVAIGIITLVLRAERSPWLTKTLVRLQDSMAQVRVRGAFVFLAAFVVLAQAFGLAAILGAFVAGMLIRIIDPDETTRHPEFRRQLEAVGFGVFVPVFFVYTGIQFDLPALLGDGGALARVPLLLVALLLVRGVPALLYRPLVGGHQAVAGGILQATSLTFILAAAPIGTQLGILRPASSAALITAGLASVIIFPALAQVLLRPFAEPTTNDTPTPASHPLSGLPRLGALALRPWRGGATPDPST